MSLPVVLRPEARAEFDEAVDWHEQQRTGPGGEYAVKAEDVFTRIAEAPERYPVVIQDVRRAAVQRFPYVVLYRVEERYILVLAVFHGRRDPKTWQARSQG